MCRCIVVTTTMKPRGSFELRTLRCAGPQPSPLRHWIPCKMFVLVSITIQNLISKREFKYAFVWKLTVYKKNRKDGEQRAAVYSHKPI